MTNQTVTTHQMKCDRCGEVAQFRRATQTNVQGTVSTDLGQSTGALEYSGWTTITSKLLINENRGGFEADLCPYCSGDFTHWWKSPSPRKGKP